MSLPAQLAAYADCIDLYERAKADEVGIRVFIGPEKSARRLQFRLQRARVLMRDEMKRAYVRDDPSWGKSEFDDLVTTVRKDEDGEWWVYIQRYGQEIGDIESLSETGT